MTLNQRGFAPESAFKAVLDWIEAVNACDARKLLTLSAQEIELIGPRGSTSGQQALTDWLNQAGMQFLTQSLAFNHLVDSPNRDQPEPVEIYVRHQAIWTSPDGQTSQADCLSIFTLAQIGLSQPKIRSYERRII